MHDYFALNKHLKLNEYIVCHSFYPVIQSFRYWDSHDKYVPLPWYQAYHAVKHDREN